MNYRSRGLQSLAAACLLGCTSERTSRGYVVEDVDKLGEKYIVICAPDEPAGSGHQRLMTIQIPERDYLIVPIEREYIIELLKHNNKKSGIVTVGPAD